MRTAQEHYSSHLSPVYVWMAGGIEQAFETGTQEIADIAPGSGLAVDLGAGFGMHSIPLARAGYQVVAIDSSATLLRVLEDNSVDLPVRTVEGDLRGFRDALQGPADLIVCMGDTLTHMESLDQVEQLCEDVSQALVANGRFVATFRDYSSPATGDARFIPVRSDADRILTCFLEESQSYMTVHDLLYERQGAHWNFKVSSYRKLRLVPTKLERTLRQFGLTVRLDSGPRGMVRITAQA